MHLEVVVKLFPYGQASYRRFRGASEPKVRPKMAVRGFSRQFSRPVCYALANAEQLGMKEALG